MANGAERISDFMGDAGGKSAEGSQLELLCLLLNFGAVLKKDDRIGFRRGCMQFRKCCNKILARRSHVKGYFTVRRIIPPAGDSVKEVIGNTFIIRARLTGCRKKPLCGLVHQPWFTIVSQHHNTCPKTTDDQLVDLFQRINLGLSFL